MDVNEDFVDVFKLKMVSGRSFSRAFPADSNNFMVNEKMLSMMGFNANTAVGKELSFTGKGMIIGVVKDFNVKPIQQSIEPMILRFNKSGGFVVIRTLPGKTGPTVKSPIQHQPGTQSCLPFQI